MKNKKKFLFFLMGLGIISVPDVLIKNINNFLETANTYILLKQGQLYYFKDGILEKIEQIDLVKNNDSIYKVDKNRLVKLSPEYFLGNNNIYATFSIPESGVFCTNNNNNNNNNW